MGRKKSRQEREDDEANLFAMCLLMPEEMVKEEIAKLGVFDVNDDRKMKKLAKIFEVSETMMALRIAQIFEFP
ncbi:MAG TPA: ImmA/IrrE family metallo-endopeptidase [Verrucomicrobiae bacterium]